MPAKWKTYEVRHRATTAEAATGNPSKLTVTAPDIFIVAKAFSDASMITEIGPAMVLDENCERVDP